MLIRSATADDAARLLEIYAYYVENTAVSFECAVPSPDEFRARIAKTLAKYPYLVLEEDGVIRGYAYAGPFKEREAYRSAEDFQRILADRNIQEIISGARAAYPDHPEKSNHKRIAEIKEKAAALFAGEGHEAELAI